MFFGIDSQHPHGGAIFFSGVVENRIDPKKLGRVRIRIMGIHTKDKQLNEELGRGFLSDDLPWAYVMRPVTSAAMDGIGETPLGLVEGTWVFGIARDGRVMNDLLIIGVTGGMPEEPPYTGDKLPKGEQEIGFQDPREESDISTSPRKYNKEFDRDPGYPDQKIPMGRYPQEKFLNEPDINRLARGEKLDDTILEEKKTGKMRFGEGDEDKRKRKEGIVTASGSTWDEAESPYAAEYPYNNVIESESGHVREMDDTPGHERIHEYHRWGTYYEIDEKGNRQLKVVGKNRTVIMDDDNIYIEGDGNITTKGSWNLLSLDEIKVKAIKDISIEALLEIEITSIKGVNITSAKEVKITSPKVSLISADANVNGTPIV